MLKARVNEFVCKLSLCNPIQLFTIFTLISVNAVYSFHNTVVIHQFFG